MASGELTPHPTVSEGELEEMVREVIRANFPSEIAHAATVWLDERIALYNLARESGFPNIRPSSVPPTDCCAQDQSQSPGRRARQIEPVSR